VGSSLISPGTPVAAGNSLIASYTLGKLARMSDLVAVFKPCFGNEEADTFRETLGTGWIALGPKTREFEKRFAERTARMVQWA
jgi:hypothetical protein